MDIPTYQQAVQRTCVIAESQPVEAVKLALIGLSDELGEIAGPLKKYLYHGHDLNVAYVQDEIGDLLWYLATLCNALGISLQDALQGNINKLALRYPDGFSSERSIHRVI